ncbi:MAG: hypothetical protein AAF556_11470 [Pseudomonadota bacterium]
MSGLFETRRQQARRRRRRRFFLSLALVLIAAAGAGGFYLGRDSVISKDAALRAEIITLEQAQQDLVESLAVVQQATDAADAARAAIEADYARDVPPATLRPLINQLNARLDDGMAVDRLRFVLENLSAVDRCDSIEVKRFRPRTRLSGQPSDDNRVGFALGAVQITALGSTAEDADRNPVAWYDPGNDVTVTFTLIDGRSFESAGQLPLRDRLVIGDREHRFIFSEGPRSFMLATHQSCAFP